MALVLEKMISPVTGRPAQRFIREAETKLDIAVVFTSVGATLAALKEAAKLASSLGARVTLMVPQIAPYPLARTSPAVPIEFAVRRLRIIAIDSRIETRVSIYLCRDPFQTLKSVLNPNSLVVVGSRKTWWPTAEKRLAAKLRRAGHQVVVTEKE